MPDPKKKKNGGKKPLSEGAKNQLIEIIKKQQASGQHDPGIFEFGSDDPIFDDEEEYYDYYSQILEKNNALDPKHKVLVDNRRMSKKDAMLMSPRIKFPNFEAYQKMLKERENADFDGRYLKDMNKNARVKYGIPTSKLGHN